MSAWNTNWNPMGGTMISQNPYSLPRMEIIRVNGQNGAEALQMAPNSSALLLDNTAPIVWLAQTDGAGYKTVEPFDIIKHQTIDMNNVITGLEQRLSKLEEIINEQSYTGQSRPKKQRQQQSAEQQSIDTTNQ